MYDIDKIRARAMEISDPNSSYTQEDFDKEFNNSKVFDTDDYKIKLTFTNKSNNPDPEYATNGSSGFDLRANIVGKSTIATGDIAIIPTGLYFNIPDNFEIQVRPRSGLAAKHGVTVLNTPGTIDADYRGEIKVILINHGHNNFTIEHGDRIAQAVIASVISKNIVKLKKVDDISDDTERGSGGLGSTGSK